MNVKTYGFVKYVATLGALFLFLAPLLGFLQQWSFLQPSHFRNNFVFHTQTALAATIWVLELVGVILVFAYVFIRERLKSKSTYVYTKKDQMKLNWAYIFYGCEMIISFVYVVISCGIFKAPASAQAVEDAGSLKAYDHSIWSNVVGVMITFAPFYVAQFAVAILAAIFESMSRVQEQVHLYQEQEENKDRIDVSKTGSKRTKEAQSLLSDDEDVKKKSRKTTKSKKSGPHKAEAKIDDAKALEDFFNEEEDEEEEKDNK